VKKKWKWAWKVETGEIAVVVGENGIGVGEVGWRWLENSLDWKDADGGMMDMMAVDENHAPTVSGMGMVAPSRLEATLDDDNDNER
jgi:hypothetical protein